MLTPATELEAVNDMLAAIGEAPVNSLTEPVAADASLAHALLKRVSREVQSMGWHWNRDPRVVFVPENTTGFIYLPDNVLRLNEHPSVRGRYDLTRRGNRLYDRKTQSFVFSEPVPLEVAWGLPWEDLPEPARAYIMARAGRVFLNRAAHDGAVAGFSLSDEQVAWARLLDAELEQKDQAYLLHYDQLRGLVRHL